MERISHTKNYNVIYIHLPQLLKIISLPISIYQNVAFVNNQIQITEESIYPIPRGLCLW